MGYDEVLKLEDALHKIQQLSTSKYADLIKDIDKNPEDVKQQVISYIEKLIVDNNFKVKEYDNETEELAKRIYKEMSGFSILDDFFEKENIVNIEEINILSWKDIIVYYNNGKRERSKHHFFNAQHCRDILLKLLQKNNMKFNKTNPIVIGYLQINEFNIRITVISEPIVDKKLGACASIRIINPRKMQKDDFLNNGLCNDEMLNILCLLYRCYVSMVIIGETGSGKTTLMSYVMEQIPKDKRLITMEENTREYNLHTYDDNGYMTNNVMHLITRESEKDSENITLSYLLKTALTSHPDYLCVSEMKGDESVQAVASANTGHPVIGTTHASSDIDAYYRILFLSKQSLKNDINTEILLNMICRAFPIVVNIKYYADNIRRISQISECIGLDKNNNIIINPLYKFEVKENIEENGKIIVDGYFKKINPPSNNIKEKFLENGITKKVLNVYFDKEQ